MVGLLSDKKIKEYVKKGIIKIEPFDENSVGPSSYDVRLGYRFRIFKNRNIEAIDIKNYKENFLFRKENKDEIIESYTTSDLIILKNPEKYIVIHPGEFILASVYEYIELPDNIAAQIQGRSSIARLGLIIHTSAGWIDPGYAGHLTLEIINVNKMPIKLYPLIKIAQIQFFELEEKSEEPYNKRKNSKYYKEEGATESRISIDFLNSSKDF